MITRPHSVLNSSERVREKKPKPGCDVQHLPVKKMSGRRVDWVGQAFLLRRVAPFWTAIKKAAGPPSWAKLRRRPPPPPTGKPTGT